MCCMYTVYSGMQEWVIQIPSIPILVSVLFPSLHLKYFRIKFLLLVHTYIHTYIWGPRFGLSMRAEGECLPVFLGEVPAASVGPCPGSGTRSRRDSESSVTAPNCSGVEKLFAIPLCSVGVGS